ncbi:YdcF family protein [Nocardia ninae]|uniref:DUF218 domain-containing protein n=1 Tax=Nocardia ninae NBRC 108245 TaxID=1210091 RepID=A0A511M769_9NOCA|nr:YdcF family protein [Nocardia ninae]GEM36472.1 hypothetical protein NN4_09910 [Nocardia ninae NBRC 108245]
MLVVGSVLSVVAAVYVTALWPVYVRPRADHPAAADAVVVLGGAHPRDREQLGFELVRDGYAPQLILSNSHYGDDLPDHDQTLNRICASTYSFKVHCLAPVPDTTRGEAREIVRLAREERWQRVIVVTFIPHLSRARYIIGKCFAGEVLMVPARSRLSVREWAYNYVHQSFGYGRAYFENC